MRGFPVPTVPFRTADPTPSQTPTHPKRYVPPSQPEKPKKKAS
jgi:hypothetical protein